LCESHSTRPHRTQIDVALRGITARGPVALLIELKLTETDFGHCSVAINPNNDTPAVCTNPGALGGDAQRCFKLRNDGDQVRRRNDEFLPAMHRDPAVPVC
jgi:hypothetical protein